MAKATLEGNGIHTDDELPRVRTEAPDFRSVKSDPSELSLSDLKGKKVVMNVFPSLDTSVCAALVRCFNKEVVSYPNTAALAVPKDLPFAHGRLHTTEGIDKVITLSVLRCLCFENKYRMLLVDDPLKGLLARGVIVVDGAGKIIYEELIPEITTEPDYDAALVTLK